MIEEEAIVISKDRGFAEVDIIRTKPCGLCGKTQVVEIVFGVRFSHSRKEKFKFKITLMPKLVKK